MQLIEGLHLPPNTQVYLLTDSLYAIGSINEAWTLTNPLHQDILRYIRTRLDSSQLKWHLNWVPGHAGIPSNEVADQAAVRGSQRSKRGKGFTDLRNQVNSHQNSTP